MKEERATDKERLTQLYRGEAENAINALELLGAVDALKLLLGYLKKTIKSLDPDYDIAQDPT